MKKVIDNFSVGSASYKKFRPTYPIELYDFILSHVSNYNHAWDCATGNGQVAEVLSDHFQKVLATDISAAQLEQATSAPNVTYQVHRAAEKFEDHTLRFDLVTVAQAIHWFDIERFLDHVRDILKPDGILAVWGYGILGSKDDKVNQSINHFCNDIVGPYWDPERSHIDNQYKLVESDSLEAMTHDETFCIEVNWSAERLASYFSTWSAVRHFISKEKYDPVAKFFKDHPVMNNEEPLTYKFPVFLKLFKRLRF